MKSAFITHPELGDFADFEKGELLLVDWEDIQEQSNICEHVQGVTCPSKSVGWFDEARYDKVPILVIIKEYRGDTLDKQALPLGSITEVQRLKRLTVKTDSVI